MKFSVFIIIWHVVTISHLHIHITRPDHILIAGEVLVKLCQQNTVAEKSPPSLYIGDEDIVASNYLMCADLWQYWCLVTYKNNKETVVESKVSFLLGSCGIWSSVMICFDWIPIKPRLDRSDNVLTSNTKIKSMLPTYVLYIMS